LFGLVLVRFVPSTARGIRQRIERKLKFLRGEIDDRKIASLYRSLLRAGFSADVVRRELRPMTREDVPEVNASLE
jgi:hypothetical protein